MAFIANCNGFSLGNGIYNNAQRDTHNHFYGSSTRRLRDETELEGPSESPARKRRQREEDDGFKIIKNRHLKLTFEIGGGPGYLIHAGLSKGRAVIVKVFHAHAGPVSRQQLESTVALSRELLHPNVLRIEGVSSPKSLDHFIAYENVFWKNAECPLAVALKENLERSIVLGFKMVGGLASGMNYLAIQGISFAAMGVKNFDIFLDSDDRFLISINPCMAGATDSEAEEEEDDGSWRILNALCQKVLHSANRALHNEDIDREPVALDSFRTPRVSKPTPLLITSGPSGAAEPQQIEERPAFPPRREYVWRTMARGQQCLATVARRIDSHLSLASLLHRMAYTDVKNPHRCPGYTREEITLTTNTVDSVVAEHDTPSPREICPICHDVVGLNELFSCPCGDPNPGTQCTVKCQICEIWSHSACTVCGIWSHSACTGNPTILICQRCWLASKERRPGSATTFKALIYNDGLIPVDAFRQIYQRSPLESAYLEYEMGIQFRAALDHWDRTTRRWLLVPDSDGFWNRIAMGTKLWIRISTGQLCIEVNDDTEQDSQSLPRVLLGESILFGAHLTSGINLEKIISTMHINDVHHILSYHQQGLLVRLSEPGSVRLGSLSWPNYKRSPVPPHFNPFSKISISDRLVTLSDVYMSDWKYTTPREDSFPEAALEILSSGWTRLSLSGLPINERRQFRKTVYLTPAAVRETLKCWLVQANYVMDKSSLSAEECFVIYTVTVTLSIQPMAGAPTDDIYLFLFPANVDDSLDMHLPTECETYFWSFDPFGIERLSQDTLNELALPHIDFEGFVGAAQWSHEDYHLIGQVHCTRGFDPAGQDVAIALRYPLLDVDAVVMNDDEEGTVEYGNRTLIWSKFFSTVSFLYNSISYLLLLFISHCSTT